MLSHSSFRQVMWTGQKSLSRISWKKLLFTTRGFAHRIISRYDVINFNIHSFISKFSWCIVYNAVMNWRLDSAYAKVVFIRCRDARSAVSSYVSAVGVVEILGSHDSYCTLASLWLRFSLVRRLVVTVNGESMTVNFSLSLFCIIFQVLKYFIVKHMFVSLSTVVAEYSHGNATGLDYRFTTFYTRLAWLMHIRW